MKRQQISKPVIGLVSGSVIVHILTLLVNYFSRGEWLLCMPELVESMGWSRAIIMQTVLGGLFGMVSYGGTCFFDIEKWSLLRASLVHCLSILITDLIVGGILHWFSFHLISILIVSGSVILIYILIWLALYSHWKRQMREMNTLTKKYKKTIEEKD
jgi:hypothetical protein